MTSGALDRRVTVERAVETNTGKGVTLVWSELMTVWASRKDISDAERAASGKVQGSVISRFIVRWSPSMAGIKPKDRLIEGGLTFEIRGIKEVGRRQMLEITAEAGLD